MSQRTIYSQLIAAAKSALNYVVNIRPDLTGTARENAAYVVFSAGCSAGQVVVESAHDPTYTGTWQNIGTVNWSAASRVHEVCFTGFHAALRFRIASAIVGGTVDLYAGGN